MLLPTFDSLSIHVMVEKRFIHSALLDHGYHQGKGFMTFSFSENLRACLVMVFLKIVFLF